MTILKKRIEKTAENLRKNNMEAFIVNNKSEVLPLVKSLLAEGCTVSTGGSKSLSECGIFDLLKNGKYNFLDRNAEGLTPAQTREIFLKSFCADAYLCSSNAVTENGELYNVDGNSNRVAAICYGPESVIMVVGYNKIVKDISEAAIRVKKIAAPANCDRLGANTYCREKGECKAFIGHNLEISSGCSSDSRICCNYVISAKQKHFNRIKVILVCEEIGY